MAHLLMRREFFGSAGALPFRKPFANRHSLFAAVFSPFATDIPASRYTFVAVMVDGKVELERSSLGGCGCSGTVHAGFV